MMSAFVPTTGRLSVLTRSSAFSANKCASQSPFSCSLEVARAARYNRCTISMQDDEEDFQGEGGGYESPASVEDAKLFVGNLSWNTTDSSLGHAFSEFGEVIDSKVVTDRFTGKSRGFGFITFADPAAASTALEQMNGQEVDGRSIRIDRANKRVGNGGGAPRGAPRRNYY